jgi:cell division septal protein FtsQ
MAFRKKKIGTSNYRRAGSTARKHLPKKRRVPGKTLSQNEKTPHKSSRRKRQNVRRAGILGQIKRSFIFILLGGAVFYIVYALFLSNTLTIQNIDVFENDIQVKNHPIADLLIDFTGSNLLLFSDDEIEPYLRTQYPEYEILKLSKNLPDTLTIILKTYPVVAEIIVNSEQENEQEFLLTRAGQTAAYDTETSMDQELRKIYIESEQSLNVGATVITQESLAFMLEAIQSYEDRFGMAIEYVEYYDIERETHLLTERNFWVWLDMTMDLDEQFDKLKKGLPRLDIYEMNLMYIDLRISGMNGEKIIFKRR